MQKISLKNKLNQKIISAILIVAIITPVILVPLLSAPKQVNAQIAVTDIGVWAHIRNFFLGSSAASNAATAVNTTTTTAITVKQWAGELLRGVLRVFAMRLLAKMTEATVNWINSGFHGQPLFLENPESFFKDIAKYEIKNLINTIGYDSNRFPFGKAFALNVIQSYKSTFESNAQYSLSKVINDPVLLNNFRNDFSVGGWNGFLLNTQYPQNNYIGSQMLYSNELARVLANNPVSTKISKVQDTLQKGMGFLSPQTCPSNPNYPVVTNPYNPPTFKKTPYDPPPIEWVPNSDTYATETEASKERRALYEENWKRTNTVNKENFDKKYNCPKGLVDTTPGSVVASHITRAINSPFFQTELGMAFGNSLSAIFDALFNQFLSKGLNALTSKKNTPPPADDFDYYGQTLGSPSPSAGTATGSGTGFDWSGPDQVIILADFKRDVQNLLDNANKELNLIDNNDPAIPGIIQLFNQIFPKTQELDMCLPGPNLGWQERMDLETQTAGGELQAKGSDPDLEKANAATQAYSAFTYATDSFKEWLDGKINSELASSAEYLDAVNSVEGINSKNNELSARKSTISETLVKLQSIKTQLDAITTEPARGSAEEATVVRLKQRIDGMILDLSTSSTVVEMQNNLDDAKDKLTNLDRLITECATERTGKGWSVPGGEASLSSGKTEKEIFCSLPIAGGYSHKSFVNHGTVTHSEIPLVNATKVYPPSGVVDADIDITLSCDAIYRTSISDYKKSVPSP